MRARRDVDGEKKALSGGGVRAADSTYAALQKDWGALVAAHPKQKFEGL